MTMRAVVVNELLVLTGLTDDEYRAWQGRIDEVEADGGYAVISVRCCECMAGTFPCSSCRIDEVLWMWLHRTEPNPALLDHRKVMG